MQTQAVAAAKPWSFPVCLQDVFVNGGIQVPRTKSVVRTDTGAPLSIVSDRYTLFPHETVIEGTKPLVQALGKPESQYFLERNGARLIAQHTFKEHVLKLPAHGTQDRAVGDVVALRVHVINSYNASTNLEIRLAGLVLRCLNGLTVPAELFSFGYRHCGDGDWQKKLPSPDRVVAAFNNAEENLQRWANHRLTLEQKDALIDEAIKLQVISMTAYNREEERFDDAETLWDWHNAATYVTSHVQSRLQLSGRLQRVDRLNGLLNSYLPTKVA